MDFLGMGTGEFLLVLFLALLIFGPEKLPGMARTFGRVIRQFKQASDDFTKQVNSEVDAVEAAKKEVAQKIKGEVSDVAPVLRDLDPTALTADETNTGNAGKRG